MLTVSGIPSRVAWSVLLALPELGFVTVKRKQYSCSLDVSCVNGKLRVPADLSHCAWLAVTGTSFGVEQYETWMVLVSGPA